MRIEIMLRTRCKVCMESDIIRSKYNAYLEFMHDDEAKQTMQNVLHGIRGKGYCDCG